MEKRCIFRSLAMVACSVGVAFGAFTDDFNDPASSNPKWVTSGDKVTIQFVDKTCKITNTDTTYAGMAYHTFPNPKPELFTLSAKIVLAQGAPSAGFVCCMTLDTKVMGYNVSFSSQGDVSVDKVGSSSAATGLVSTHSAYLTTGTNELKISRKEGVFNLFCNGRFTATFTDTEFPRGDIALLVDAKSTVTFDDVVLADTFETGVAPTCFADNFDDGNLLGWSSFGDANAHIVVTGGALRITTSAAGQGVYAEADLGLNQFVMNAVVSFRGGSTDKSYGLFVRGTAPTSVPLAGFGITAGKLCGAFLAGKEYSPVPSTSIKGAPYVSATGDTTFYNDTLQVIKRNGSAEYLFVVNADTLARLTGVDFAITGVGVFCSEGVDVVVDNFLAAEGTSGECPVSRPSIARVRGGKPEFGNAVPDMRVFDLSGRLVAGKRGVLNSAAAEVPGVYLRSGGARAMYRTSR